MQTPCSDATQPSSRPSSSGAAVAGFKFGVIGRGPAAFALVYAMIQAQKEQSHAGAGDNHVDIVMFGNSDKSAAWSGASPAPLLSHQPRKYFSERLDGFDIWAKENLPEISKQLRGTKRGRQWLEEFGGALTDNEDIYNRLPRSVIGAFLEQERDSVRRAAAESPDISLEERDAEVSAVTQNAEGKLVLRGRRTDNGGAVEEEYDHVVLASGMTPPYVPRKELPENFFDNMSAPVAEGTPVAGRQATDQFDAVEKRIIAVLEEKRKIAEREGRPQEEAQVTVAVLGHGGAVALDAEYYLSGLDDDIKNGCRFLKFGNPDSARPKAVPPDESLHPFACNLGKHEDFESLSKEIRQIKDAGAKQGYSEGNMRPVIAEKYMEAVSALPCREPGKIHGLVVKFYGQELATEAAASVDAAASLPNAEIINARVDMQTPETEDGVYIRDNGLPAFVKNREGAIEFYDVEGGKHKADICLNCTGQIWKTNPKKLKDMGVTDALVSRNDFSAAGVSVFFLPVSQENKENALGKTAIRPGDIVAQLGAVTDGAKNIGRRIIEERAALQRSSREPQGRSI